MSSLLSLLLLSTGAAQADFTLMSETANGNSSFTETISGMGDLGSPNSNSAWGWNLALTSSVTKGIDNTGSRTLTDRTTEAAGGAVWDFAKKFTLGFGLMYSRTPEEYLTTSGTNADFTYTLQFKRDHNDDPEVFHPWMAFRTGFATNRYLQSFGTTVRRVTRPTSGDNAIRQNQFNAGIKAKPWSWFKVRLSLKRYAYDRDVNSFLTYLDSSLAVRAGFDGLFSAVSGFPESGSVLEFSFYPGETWELIVAGSAETSAMDGSKATSGSFQANKAFGNWRIGLGVQTHKAEATTLNPEPLNEGLGLLMVSYDFLIPDRKVE